MSGMQPLVAVVSRVPLLSEGIAAALADVAEVRLFAANGGTDGLLRSVRPDAIIVDDRAQAEDSTPFAREAGTPLFHISLRDGHFQVLGIDGWSDGDGASPEAIRNAVAGALYGRGRQ